MTGYDDATRQAGRALAAARARRDALPAREAAVEAYVPGGPSVDELEQRIAADRLDRSRAESVVELDVTFDVFGPGLAGQRLVEVERAIADETPPESRMGKRIDKRINTIGD